ncbi:helix-turn-helix domain-containing protein [Flavobacterium piscisymbiosum]|uniref:AraC family transcriptional regulator n=1 Tax=Flavobacterium piscisymbiosum TaxID=2893753 RepID=A0ABS8MLF7_9FLAO|nr:AraC family transcriptional regulator [Flavobacterium sp. F-30]MCC9066339.1 AraC family transcriptional regulator [Flavobacterium sp. F-30]
MKATREFANPALKSVLKQRGFKVTWNKVTKTGTSAFGRRHFYLILLSIGNSKIHYDDQTIHLNGVYLFFANSRIPYATEIISEKQTGYSCVFTEEFIKPLERLENLQHSPLFQLNSNPAFKLNKEQQNKITDIFNTMITSDKTNYLYKDDLMRTYIELIIHDALQMRPAENFIQSSSASLRIVNHFMDQLERQFPIENLSEPLKFKSAQDFAGLLSIHVNYLNRAVKEVTGKSTTTIIAERITAEATTLLRYTDWSISEIAHILGFEYPNYFSSFFKKITGNIPKFYRDP